MPRLFLIILAAVACSQCSGPITLKQNFSKLQQRAQKGDYPDHHEDRLGAFLDLAAQAQDRMLAKKTDDTARALAIQDYNTALSAFFFGSQKVVAPKFWMNGKTFHGVFGSYKIEFTKDPTTTELPPVIFDEFFPPSKGVPPPGDPHRRSAYGIAMVGTIYKSEDNVDIYPLLPPNGARLPVTALLDFTDKKDPASGARIVRMKLLDTIATQECTIAGKKVPLSYDLAKAVDMAMDDDFWGKFGTTGLLRPASTRKYSSVYRITRHTKGKIPVVFVHGLNADPHMWEPAILAILGDKTLREHYEPWYFVYPTGLNVPANAARLRQSLQQAIQFLDPTGTDPGIQNLILVGHSMGGLVSRLQTVDSGMELWNAYFTKRPEELQLSNAPLMTIKESLIFNKIPQVDRVIFMAVPHRGSNIARWSLVRALLNLIRLPDNALRLTGELLTLNYDALNPEIISYKLQASGVDHLSPVHPYYKALEKLPPGVPHHSIIGKVGTGPLEQSSDAVVPYWSSHLATAESEAIIPWWHNLAHREDTLQELTRLLWENLPENVRNR